MSGREGSERGQIQKTEDLAQIQSKDEIRGQAQAGRRRCEGRSHHNLGEPRG
jgi:hypothetical protein